jgi:hypothetical protein
MYGISNTGVAWEKSNATSNPTWINIACSLSSLVEVAARPRSRDIQMDGKNMSWHQGSKVQTMVSERPT